MLSEIHLSKLGWLFSEIVLNLRPDISLECGAREASFSRSLEGFIKEIYAFEANESTFRLYVDEIPKNIRYLNLGISNRSGRQEFQFFAEDSPYSGSSSLSTFVKANRKPDIKVIDTVRLDDFLQQHTDSAFKNQNLAVWIDAEGTTFEILDSLGSHINNVMALHVEVELIKFWKGQKVFSEVHSWIKAKDFYPVARDYESTNQYNIVYLNDNFISRGETKELLLALQKKDELQAPFGAGHIRFFDLDFVPVN